MKITRSAAAIGAAAVLATTAAGCGGSSSSGTTAGSAAPAKLVVWRMGSSVPSQVTWMNGVVSQFHKKFPAYKNTKVVVDWIPWGDRVTDWTNALSSAPSDYTNAIVSFIWGAGGQVAVQKNGQWAAELDSPASEAGIKFYADLYLTEHLSPAKYIGQTELGAPGATSGGSDQDFAEGKLDMYIDGPWAQASLETVSKKYESDWASFPIPSENGPSPAPAFAGGSDLGIWAKSQNKTAAWDLITLMDAPSNATTFANSQGFFPEFTTALGNPTYAASPILSGFAKAAGYTQISPLNSKNWATADATDAIIPTMMKALMQGANFKSTITKANTELQNVLNTGNEFIVALTFLGQTHSLYTLPIYVTYFFGRGGAEWGPIMAASTLYTIPVMIFFLIVRRRLVGGLVAGAVKG